METAGPPKVGLWVLGDAAELLSMGSRDLPHAVWDREQLPATASGADSDLHPGSAAAFVVCGRGVDPAECLGVAALGGLVTPPTRRQTPGSESIAFSSHVDVVVPTERIALWIR